MNQTTFSSLEEIREKYNIKQSLFLGEPSYVQFIEHPILVRNSEDSPIDVQIGVLCGNSFSIYPELAEQADRLYSALERYLDSGDHGGIIFVSLINMGDEGYRIYAVPSDEDAEEDIEFSALTLDALLAKL